jgi:hypothetical protein
MSFRRDLEEGMLKLFPEAARRKYHSLADTATTESGLVRALYEKSNRLHEVRMDIQLRHDSLTRPQFGKRQALVKSDDPRVLELDREWADCDAEEERLRELRERHGGRWSDAKRLQVIVEAFVSQVIDAGKPLKMHSGRVPRRLSGEFGPEAVERCRSLRKQLLGELKGIETAPRPSSQAKQYVREWVEQLATRGQISPFALIESGAPLSVPKLMAEVLCSERRPVTHVYVADSLGLLAWTDRSDSSRGWTKPLMQRLMIATHSLRLSALRRRGACKLSCFS